MLAQRAVLVVPPAGLEVGGEAGDDPLLDLRLDQLPRSTGRRARSGRAAPRAGSRRPRRSRRCSRPGVGIVSIRVRPPSSAATSSDGAEARHARSPPPRRSSRAARRAARSSSKVKTTTGPRGDAAQLREAAPRAPASGGWSRRPSPRRPSRRRAAAIRRCAASRRRRVGRPLRPHRRARLDRQHPAVARLIGPRPRADIEHGPRVPQRSVDRAPRSADPPAAAARTPRHASRSPPARPLADRTGSEGAQSTWPGVR